MLLTKFGKHPIKHVEEEAIIVRRKKELDICCRHRRRILPALRHRPLTDPSFPVDATNVMQVYELQEYTILTFEPLTL